MVILYIKSSTAQHTDSKGESEHAPGKDVDLMLLGDKMAIRPLFRYIKGTQRFEESHGNVELPEEEEPGAEGEPEEWG